MISLGHVQRLDNKNIYGGSNKKTRRKTQKY